MKGFQYILIKENEQIKHIEIVNRSRTLKQVKGIKEYLQNKYPFFEYLIFHELKNKTKIFKDKKK